ncbi:hypothetical protein [Polaribacter cellanae]|uniref:Uncharacterized protein n=1 Tax=Polaribacter cellanae TaxID=2818493 RepID=A0A975H5L7_9FLAO|nr:hypothetical protein [Polaribacter cellanae]QTE21014.1 hypothetical protein J3359_09130 [Polaribacter cellanae]
MQTKEEFYEAIKNEDIRLRKLKESNPYLLEEIIYHMDINFPDWLTNQGVGKLAGFFIWTIFEEINKLKIITVDENFKKRIGSTYIFLKSINKQVFEYELLNKFNNDFEEQMNKCRYLPTETFEKLCDEAFQFYLDFFQKQTTFEFKNKLFQRKT